MSKITNQRPKVGVSACLLGEKVRFDGQAKSDSFSQSLSKYFDLEGFCPEMGIGLGAPRASLRLVGSPQNPTLIQPRTGKDLTQDMIDWSEKSTALMKNRGFIGFIFKKDSPSCGMERVRVYRDSGMPEKDGVGIFSSAVMHAFPWLVCEEEGRLKDPKLRARFVTRLFAHARVQALFQDGWTIRQLIAFHSKEKYLLMAQNPDIYKKLGRLVANAVLIPLEDMERRYTQLFLTAFLSPPSKGRNINVMQHMLGYFKKVLGPIARKSIRDAMIEYRSGFLPLSVPLSLLKHYSHIHGLEYLLDQSYFEPYDKILRATQHVQRV